MVLVFTDEDGRILYHYREYSQLNEPFRSQGTEIDEAEMDSVPEVAPWQQAVPFLVDGQVVWSIEGLPEDHPEHAKRKLQQYETAGEHSFVNPL